LTTEVATYSKHLYRQLQTTCHLAEFRSKSSHMSNCFAVQVICRILQHTWVHVISTHRQQHRTQSGITTTFWELKRMLTRKKLKSHTTWY